MAEVRKTVDMGVPTRTNEMIAQVIAGPETAARLGVPVGTVIDARHVITDAATGEQLTELGKDIVSPGDAQATLDSWKGDEN